MSNIIMLQLTREEAAAGSYRTINTPSGPTVIQIPPVQDGMLIRIPIADGGEVYARIQIVASGYQMPPKRSRVPVVVGVSAAAVFALAVIIGLTVSQHGGNNAGPTNTVTISTDTPTDTPTDTTAPTDDPATDDPATSDPTDDPATDQPPTTDPSPTFSPYSDGTCLNGTLPDSATAQTVTDVNVVDCGASDAHYKVIQSIFGTDDLHRCDSNSETQYEFSSVETWGGSTISSVVYCVVGLGSYAR